MSRAAAEQPAVPARSLGTAALPWMLSSTLHATAIVLLALSWEWTNNAPPAAGIALEAGFLPSDAAAENPAAARFEAPPSEGYFDEDQPLVASVREQRPGGAQALGALLDEEPAVDLAGVLPASGAELGLGGRDSGVGSAEELTKQPPPPSRPSGGTARTGVFGIVGEGNKFVYVFDRSGSMDGHGGAPLVAAKNELVASLEHLGQTHQFQIIFYNEEPKIFNPAGRSGRLVFGTDQNKHLARRFVGSITASGPTRHLEALKLALRMNPDVIFFLTDADEPRMSPEELADIARMNQGTSINAIEFGYGSQHSSENFLVALARQNGGQHVYVDVSKLGRR